MAPRMSSTKRRGLITLIARATSGRGGTSGRRRSDRNLDPAFGEHHASPGRRERTRVVSGRREFPVPNTGFQKVAFGNSNLLTAPNPLHIWRSPARNGPGQPRFSHMPILAPVQAGVSFRLFKKLSDFLYRLSDTHRPAIRRLRWRTVWLHSLVELVPLLRQGQ